MIVLDSICKSFGENEVLKNVCAEFPEGSVTCIMGVSGGGKTTLLNVISGLLPADSGTVTGVPERISFVFQEDRLCESFNAVRNALIFIDGADENEIRSDLTEIGLGKHLSVPVRDMSGGMKRRTAIVRAACANADLLLLDEPFKGLDEATRRITAEYLLRKCKGKTVIMVAHDPEDAALMNAKIIHLK